MERLLAVGGRVGVVVAALWLMSLPDASAEVAHTASLDSGAAPVARAAASSSPEAGRVRFLKVTNSSFDRFTLSPTEQQQAWMRRHYWRMIAYPPYFDSRTSWYGEAWANRDAYGIYLDQELVTDHPSWILRDERGAPLYIPYACDGHECPQYAGDFGNPEFRQWWIERARRDLAEGYRGIYIDDVNLDWRVGDGGGRWVQPRDPRTGRAMRLQDWRRYMAEFLELVRSALRHREIAQNVIWYAGGPGGDGDPYVRRALDTADYVVLERGVNDGGLTNGNGRFGLGRFLAYVDRRHAHGTPVVFDANRTDARGREYGLAGYFLISSGRDGTGNPAGSTPDAWWSGYDVDLGRPLARRYAWHGLLRRDFTRGLVLLNQPNAPTARVRLARPYRDLEGRLQRNLTLAPATGRVLSPTP